MIAHDLPAAVLGLRPSRHHHPLRHPRHEDLPVPPPRPAPVDQDRTSRRGPGRLGPALHPEYGALGRVVAEAMEPVAAESHETGPRYLVPGAPVTRRRCEFEHLDRAHSQWLAAFVLGHCAREVECHVDLEDE